MKFIILQSVDSAALQANLENEDAHHLSIHPYISTLASESRSLNIIYD